ncbi:hypothetical protein AADZ90_017950 [Aestuariibius sp. 2305UL40-4]|uniref:hypothetical protein n=1 Tax=Aestuariibius violaceus TaxID=3234132 RepID=UPI00345E49AE
MPATPFNILAVAQSGRLQYEAILLAASLRDAAPGFPGKLIFAEPQPGPLWPNNPRIGETARALLTELGAEIRPFENKHFGHAYPYGNKIEGLAVLPEREPFLFLDTDTLILGDPMTLDIDFSRPSASLKREGTWPVEDIYWPGYNGVWGSLYKRFGLDFESSLDLSQPDEYWRRYLYFNAGFFYYEDPKIFHDLFLRYALSIRDDTPEELASQTLDPWLDQIALPLVIHALGGGRDGPHGQLDGTVTCHWRALPLAYAREADAVIDHLEEVAAPNRIKKVLKEYDPFKRLIFQGRGRKARALFDRDNLPRKEQKIRNLLKKEGYWLR